MAILFIRGEPLGDFGESLMRNICDFGPVVWEEISFKRFLLFLTMAAILLGGAEPFTQFWWRAL